MTTTNKPNLVYWIIAVIAVIWNLMGVIAYLGQAYMTDEAKMLLPEADRAYQENIPAWAIAAFAIAVFGGFFGAIGLLLKKKWATPLFIISLLGILVQLLYNLILSNSMEVYGPSGLIMPIMVVVIGVILVWYSKKATSNRWLN